MNSIYRLCTVCKQRQPALGGIVKYIAGSRRFVCVNCKPKEKVA